eukprot:Amastigsp_a841231_77.p3 type:complete len:177 gc:universal Amastigsp_a841231_77:304-834(+)
MCRHRARVAREDGVINEKQHNRKPGEESPRAEPPPDCLGRVVPDRNVPVARRDLGRVDDLAQQHTVAEAPQLLAEDDDRGRDRHRRNEPPEAQHKHRKRLVQNHQRPRVRRKEECHGEIVQAPGRRQHARQDDNSVEPGHSERAYEAVRPALLETRKVCNRVHVRLVDGRAVVLES